MRFAIYARDGYRCRKCKRKTNDLEVDHIYPISKGGKSNFNNLQTLCRRCNKRKGANIEY
ncbi:MAG: HNH endonuclease [Erysipelotrichia bacterium]|nr:HNH endonuclease [Erysipelotrichia bacterium]